MRSYTFAPGEFYHIYSRGIEKRQIFMDPADQIRFRKLLLYCNGTRPVAIRNLPRGLSLVEGMARKGEAIVEIGAFCLMPNHFHLLVRETSGQGISTFMRKLLTGYSSYFNTRYERKGRLFESSFKSRHVDSDEYLKYLFSYIHLNPLKLFDSNWKESGLKNTENASHFLRNYESSSFGEVSNVRVPSGILNLANFPEYFQNQRDLMASLTDWFKYQDKP